LPQARQLRSCRQTRSTIVAEGRSNTYRVGETFSMTHGCRHSEQAGTDGATYVAGRRMPAN